MIDSVDKIIKVLIDFDILVFIEKFYDEINDKRNAVLA
ncbi:hypothetical protein BALOs_0977 [Halobacteriovorax sp. BALOs_7]|nr:hypothetical protein BALOs_0977 [Halobacteriovorax sp. BALOs_7]